MTDLFPSMPETSRIWIYQANRLMTENEEAVLKEKAEGFVRSWESHGSRLKADFVILHHLFLIFSVDENQHEASGCSIDKSVHFVKDVQEALGLNFFDRTLVSYFDSEARLRLMPMGQIKEEIASGDMNFNTLTFNNLVNNLQDLRANWIVPAGQNWMARFF
jgi:hypothetical protein